MQQFNEYRSQFQSMEREVAGLKETMVERARLDEAEKIIAVHSHENEELRRRIALLEADKPPADKPPADKPLHQHHPEAAHGAPATPRAGLAASLRPVPKTPRAVRKDSWPTLKEAAHQVQVDGDGWWS